MSTAKSAANAQPTTNIAHTSPRHALFSLRRIGLVALGVLLGVSIVVPFGTITAQTVDASSRPRNCSNWSSTTQPPKTIRVLRTKSGRVQKVSFRRYVMVVMTKEWPSYLPQPLVEAGAVVVKQYAWFHAVRKGRVSRRGECFDVKDSTSDQLYRPNRARVSSDIRRAVDKTWNVRLLRKGKFFMTAYRTGSSGRCGHDANGRKLYARSAVGCAHNGLSYTQILSRYYSHLQILGAGSASQSQSAPGTQSSTSQLTLLDDRSSAIDWHGTWRRIRRGSAIHNTLSYSALRGSSASFSFVGRSLEIDGRRGPNRGWIDVYVNGKLLQRVDLLANTLDTDAVLLSKTWHKSKTRNVRIVVGGTSGRHRVDLDAIRIGG